MILHPWYPSGVPRTPHPVKQVQVAPMKILFKDEKYKADTIDILSRLCQDASLTGNPQVNTQVP